MTQRPKLAAATASSIHLRSQSPAPVVDSRKAHPGNAAATPLARAQRTRGSLPKAPTRSTALRRSSSHTRQIILAQNSRARLCPSRFHSVIRAVGKKDTRTRYLRHRFDGTARHSCNVQFGFYSEFKKYRAFSAEPSDFIKLFASFLRPYRRQIDRSRSRNASRRPG